MAKVKILTCFAGVDFSWNNGDIVEVSEKEAKAMIEAGFAEAQAEPKPAIKKPTQKKKTTTKRKVKTNE